MRLWLAIVLCAGMALTAPAAAQPDADAPIPRAYAETGFDRADPDKPADQYAREAAIADTSAVVCQAGDASACAALGTAFARGEGRPQNRPVAELLYRKACNAAVGEGCYRLAELLPATREPADDRIAATFSARACRLGTLVACDDAAEALERGTLAPPDPAAAEALRRDTCAKGSLSACRALAATLMAQDRSPADIAWGLALIDRQCRAGDVDACNDAVTHWRNIEGGGWSETIGLEAAHYRQLACDAGGAEACAAIAKDMLGSSDGPSEHAGALALYERACSIERFYCSIAEEVRSRPALGQRCDSGDQAACATLGIALANGSRWQRTRALVLLIGACDSGEHTVCVRAAELLTSSALGDGAAVDPVTLERFLALGCNAQDARACEWLADALADGVPFPRDEARAAALYAPQCDAGRRQACEFLETLSQTDPAAPLILASETFGPELTQEEIDEDARIEREENERFRAEARARGCTTTTVEYEGVSYTDTICKLVTRVIGSGYLVRPGATPWQALLWRPASRGRTTLSLQERVLCGGSVIREGWVLTAAHCINDKSLGGVSIRTGGHTIRLGLTNALGEEGFAYPIIATFAHPDYDPHPERLAFDIALVQYDPRRGKRGSNALAPARIRLDPVPLTARKVEALARVATYGWGLTAFENGVIPDRLRGGRVKLRDVASCTAEIVSFADRKRRVTNPALRFDGPKLRDSVLCADERQGAEGGQACSGDSGGPLISYSDADKVPTLIGVVSGGVFCGTTGRPSRYTRIAHPRVQTWLKTTLPPARPR
jgi:TPR repeat protein